MPHNEPLLLRELQSAFSLDGRAAQAALALLKARAASLDYSLDEYLDRYHPSGIAAADKGLDSQFSGYVDFLGSDATAIIRAGKSADFSTFVHECAHVFRRQLTGDLREKAETAFAVKDGKWTREQEEDFARGLERWVEKRRHKNVLKREVYTKGGEFVDNVYRGIEHIIDIDPRMEAVYEKLFEENRFRFNREQFETILQQTGEGKLPETSHVFLGMTPRIYEEIGLERLPMAITGKHLYTTLRESGIFDNAHYHGLGPGILHQIPEQLKKPLCIVQSPDDETDIISVVALKDKDGNPVIMPIAQHQRGRFSDAEIDVNLVKTVFGKDGFENWLKAAISQNRLLYFNKKETEPALNENLITLSRANSIQASNHSDYHHQDVSGFYTDNITRFREAVKEKFGERPFGLRRLYQRNIKIDGGQIAFDFAGAEIQAPAKQNRVTPQPVPGHSGILEGLSLPNTPEHFFLNFRAMSEYFQNDRIEAARYLLRLMSGDDRKTVLDGFREAGLSAPESIREYLAGILDRPLQATQAQARQPEPEGRDIAGQAEALRKTIIEGGDLTAHAAEQPETETASRYRPFGAWTDFNRRLSGRERGQMNAEALRVLENTKSREPSDVEKGILRRYSGFGGIAAADERGVLYDYYTSPPVADLTWKLLGKADAGIAKGASVLEPSCGTGVFFEAAPKGRDIRFTGVELDERTAAVAGKLHEESGEQNVTILHQSFEAFNLSDKRGGFDFVIGNAPFGERSPETAALDLPAEQSLDNYFVSRSVDNLKPGGTMALIAAPGVLENKSNEPFRLAMNKKAQFIGAVKLPNKSFSHSNTKVEPDILLFRKYPDDIINRLSGLSDETFKTSPLYDAGFVQGAYFKEHPEHVMGTISAGSGQWGADEVLGEVTPETLEQTLRNFSPADRDLLENSFAFIRGVFPEVQQSGGTGKTLNLTGGEIERVKDKTLGEGEVKTYEKGVYVLSGRHEWLRVSENEQLAGKINSVKRISNYVKEIQAAMRDGTPNVAEIMANGNYSHTAALQAMCASFLGEYQSAHGVLPKDDPDIKRFTREHPAVKGIYESFLDKDDPLLQTGNVYRKDIDLVDGHNRAIAALLTLREQLKAGTEETIRAVFAANADSLIAEMRTNPDVFITPGGEWLLREDFIQGDAWAQIDALREAAGLQSEGWKKQKLLYGAGEFEKAVGWTAIEDAAFSPRSSWIPQEIVRDWASGNDGLGHGHLEKLAKNNEDKWGLSERGVWREENDPLIYYLNGQKQRSNRIDTEAFNADHDELFRSYISGHEKYREQLEKEYNRTFKTHIVSPVKTYPVGIAGWKDAGAGGKTLKPHQWQSIHHLYRQGRGISALGTGFGKTATAVGLMSLLRQEGKTRRVFLQVPNNKVKDWVEEIRSVMPSLKIAACDPEESGYSNRDRRYAKYQAMARSGADVIIMPESAASEIQLTPENDERIREKVAHQYKMEKADGSARSQALAEIKGERKALTGKTNRTVSFEDFACDCLIVDEAHNYKNLFSSSLSRETGMNDGRQSAKAMSLYKKSEYIREQNSGKNVFLLTATPLTNSPLEYYNMLQYAAPEELRRMGVNTIDGFIREFANIQMGWIYDWGKGQAKEGRVLTGFKNLPTLQNLFFTYTDLQNNPGAIGLDKPLAENTPNVIPRDPRQVGAIKEISEELDRYKALKPEEREIEFPGENFLTFYTQMRTASLDLELYDPEMYKNWKNPKLEKLSQNAFDSYQKTGGGQVIFCDRVFSSDASFNMHDKIKQSLIEKGFKEKEIVIVNGFTKSGGAKSDGTIEKEVSKAIADYNSGKYKVIIGSTACVGEGVNLQKNSAALHHFDIPFRPSDFIQRNGRIDRQGNEQDKVSLHTYLAAGTIDNYSVNLVQRKAGWIDQLLRTKSEVFTNPNDENAVDADELLLALTEEWGDKEAAQERRAEMEKIKQEKIREAQTTQMNGFMKNLALARGSLGLLEGREHTKEYKKRADQIANIESALARNDVFTRKDLLGSREPFLFNAETGAVFRKGDLLVTKQGTWSVDLLDFKKQEIRCSAMLSDSDRAKKERESKLYGQGWRHNTFKVSELKPEGDQYNYKALLAHFEKADTPTRAIVRDSGSQSFYSHPDDEKARYYDLHLKICGEHRYGDGFHPAVLYTNDDGKLAVERLPVDKPPLNPFTPEGKAAITDALKKGLCQSNYGWESALDTLRETVPDIGKTVKAVADTQTEAAREAERIAEAAEQNRKNEALQKTLGKLGLNVVVTSPVVHSGRRR